MSPRTPAQNSKIQEATRARILDSAMYTFAQRGYEGTSINQIAAHAGISQGLMYHYFDSKEHLLRVVFQQLETRLSAAFKDYPAAASAPTRLEFLLRRIADAVREDFVFWQLVYVLRVQPHIAEKVGNDIQDWTQRLKGTFESCFREMDVLEPELEAAYLYAVVEGMIQQFQLSPENYPLEEILARVINQFCKRKLSQ